MCVRCDECQKEKTFWTNEEGTHGNSCKCDWWEKENNLVEKGPKKSWYQLS